MSIAVEVIFETRLVNPLRGERMFCFRCYIVQHHRMLLLNVGAAQIKCSTLSIFVGV